MSHAAADTGRLAGARHASLLYAVLWLALLHALLTLPARVDDLSWTQLLRLPVELPALVAVLCLARGRLVRPVQYAAAIFLWFGIVGRLASGLTLFSLGREFDPVLDAYLLRPAFDLVSGTYGTAAAILLACAVIGAAAGLLAILLHAVKIVGDAARSMRGPVLVTSALALVAATAGLVMGTPLATGSASAELYGQAVRARTSLGDLARFEAERADAAREASGTAPFAALEGRDVLVLFVESYGATALTSPAYRPHTERALAQIEDALRLHGLEARSAFLQSTTAGGRSWLAHSSFLAGLRIDNPLRYRAFAEDSRPTLVSDFRVRGWTTLAVMPAITRRWDEAAVYGFDRVYAADDLGYRGKPFDWVTMPDQFTLAAYQRIRAKLPGPAMAEISLLSSHFPWAPLPQLVAWDEIGDGSVFDRQVEDGEEPDAVWRDPDRVRAAYIASIEYALTTIASWLDRFGDSRPVAIIVGDHPPIPWVAGGGSGREVPVHIVGPSEAIARLNGWRWTTGMTPGETAPVWPMEAFRGKFLAAFASPRVPEDDRHATDRPR